MKKEVHCPSCGAPVVFQSAASVLAVCEYCGSTLVRHDLDLENVGKMAQLQADGSPLQLRAEGRYRGDSFTVVGRIQLRFEKGLWNEWHLLFNDQRSGWLGEAAGIYAVSFLSEVKEGIPKFEALHPGQAVILRKASYEVINVEKAFCIGGEGELPFEIGPGYEAPVADLAGPGRQFATLDYSEDPPLIYMGEYAEFEELHLSGLKEFDGW
ncbi:MAG: hypothetical protein AMJ94_07440 [Deltaproteobacteria bacterium SM23_61]|nr:MAG: hypothetical protein AMJ94_07440 [Deltaproteobacteria bacterium SM23_61]